MFVIYSPELRQVQAHTRFSNLAAQLAGFLCERANEELGRESWESNPVSVEVWEVDEIPPPSPRNFRRDDPPVGRLVGTVTMQKRERWEPWVTEKGWKW